MKTKGVGFFLIFLIGAFSLQGCRGGAPYRVSPAESVRVLIVSGAREVKIDGARGGKSSVKIIKTEEGAAVDGKRVELPQKFFPEKDFVYVNNKPYRGVLEIRNDKGGLLAINEISMEAYLAGLINNEISSKWHIEAIKAQAVVARTYALWQKAAAKNPLYDLTSTHMDQVYSGADKEDAPARSAVKATKGETLLYDGMPALTFYHSNAGGVTEASREVWNADYPYLVSVECGYDSTSPGYRWELSLSASSLREILVKSGYTVSMPESIEVRERTPSGRAKVVVMKDADDRGLILTGEEMRKMIGYGILRSTLFDVEKSGDNSFLFKGKGSGHGVGLSQWGAKGMAEDGYSYKDILLHFYPGTVLGKIY